MPKFTVTDPATNKSVELEGESAPSEQELNDIFSQVHAPQPQPRSTMQAVMESLPQDNLSPAALLGKVPDYLHAGTKWLGNKATQELQKPDPITGESFPPMLAKGLGKAVEYTPDALMLMGPPAEAAPEAVNAAKPFARRALGLPRRMLKTPFSRGQAEKAATVALEKNILPWSGSPSEALNRATQLTSNSGREIGSVLKNTPADLNQTFDTLEHVRNLITKNLPDSGTFSKAHSAIDSIQNDILSLAGQGKTVTADALNSIKNRVGSSINFLSDLASQSDNKEVVGALGSLVRSFVKASQSPETFQNFLGNQRLFSAGKLMQKGLNNEVPAQMGNRLVGPYSAIAATGELAAGQPGKAAAALGLTEGLMRRGAAPTAKAIQSIGQNAVKKAAIGSQILNRVLKPLNEEAAIKYLKEANDDPDEARRLAKRDHYDVE